MKGGIHKGVLFSKSGESEKGNWYQFMLKEAVVAFYPHFSYKCNVNGIETIVNVIGNR